LKFFRSLRENTRAVVDLSVILMIGIAFVGLAVVGFIIWIVRDELGSDLDGTGYFGQANNTMGNVTAGFDSAVNLILVAITIFVLALAISALLFLRR